LAARSEMGGIKGKVLDASPEPLIGIGVIVELERPNYLAQGKGVCDDFAKVLLRHVIDAQSSHDQKIAVGCDANPSHYD
jgi:hypothetical protein